MMEFKMSEWSQNLIGALIPFYGLKESGRISSVIVPSILRDFRKCMDREKPGNKVKESYHLDDGKTVIGLTGSRQLNARGVGYVLHEITVNQKPIKIEGDSTYSKNGVSIIGRP